MLVKAILESLGVVENNRSCNEKESCLKEFEDGSQIIVVNCYPSCPEPDLTLGMLPHSDYGFLTLLLQDELVKGLQIHHRGKWVTVEPIPNSFVVNVGDHLEVSSLNYLIFIDIYITYIPNQFGRLNTGTITKLGFIIIWGGTGHFPLH